ncbi:efflux RND transporter permease subunit [Xylella fastidiosa subsp. multiplex]|uniref:efflux RND transporter permease subunit n=1 Tax=Xylella fastidiosa TaxID=2371 RepID=UPI000165D8B8|nr:efflux RND transporter permease subunit [Xylella fastidiosa]ACA12463.1 acriflavin resistance protein [Xylella fastidiosa M12]ERI60158.1 acriflavin resistance protein [Xylella fastidiosa subsp. multiplex Griffin-1]QPB99596.1 efflux RND transporter permease subunit [Xylella fastidiosa subsp. multiplex]UIT45020.1 efflux RND transporter permease subunit [Xylella fastidiosa subsp. multiplex]
MNLSAGFIKRPIGTSLLAIGVFVLGLICYLQLSVAPLPKFQIPVIFVEARQAGADASTMASTVTAPLERYLGQIPGIKRMRSSSSESNSNVFLLFQSNRNIDSAAQDVQAAINAVQVDLPSGMLPPSYEKANPNDDPIIALALTSDTQSMDALYNVADSLLAQHLRQIQGISSVDIVGASTPAVRVDVDMHALNALGLTMDQLQNAVRAANITSPTGLLSNDTRTTEILLNSTISKAADFAQLVIATQPNGRIVRLSDIAQVYDGQQDAYQAAWFNHKRAVVMYVFLRTGANVVETVDRVKAELPTLHTYLPPGTVLTPYFDHTPTIRASLYEIQTTLIISLAMVMLTMALFLRRLAPTVIAAAIVPLSLAGAAIVMYALDFTLNNVTLLALVIAIGFVVDDAIVMIENISRHLNTGMSPLEAALTGAREIGSTIVSITVSLVVVFAPFLFDHGMIGTLFGEFGITLVAAIIISMLVSLTLTPALCSRFLSAHVVPEKSNGIGAWLERMYLRILRLYTVALDFSLRHALLLALTPLLLIVLTVMLAGAISKGTFPSQDTGLIQGRANSSATVAFEDMINRQHRITEMLLSDPAVKTVAVRLGTGRQGSSTSFNIQLKTRAEGRRESTDNALIRLSTKAAHYPDLALRLRTVQDLPNNFGGGANQGAQHRVSLQGNDLKQLEEWLPTLQEALKKNPKLRDVGSDMDTAGLYQNIVIDRVKAAQMGVSIGAIDGALYGAFGQRQVSTIYSDTNQYTVVIKALASQSATPAALDNIHVPNRNGKMVPITAIAHQVPGLNPPQIKHDNQYTTMDLSYNLSPGVSIGEAEAIIDATIKGLRLPGDIRVAIAEDNDFTNDQMNILLLATLIAVYIVLGMLYENLIHPITILSTLPAAGMGALLALYLSHTELSAISMIALILLIGIVKKNAIMMIDFALVAQRERGLEPHAAVREASIVRFRPIMMTSMVAILAAMPLAISVGEGAELRRPLGIAMIGGLLISQSLTLLSTPALYVIFSCLSQRWHAWRGKYRAAHSH